jgi:hypothetical protein
VLNPTPVTDIRRANAIDHSELDEDMHRGALIAEAEDYVRRHGNLRAMASPMVG